ncbi:MAG: hypothetical protein HY758_04415 [Nitrospirae bacterium]|nr:hypothetical protein [Nitrospirota bacterium]
MKILMITHRLRFSAGLAVLPWFLIVAGILLISSPAFSDQKAAPDSQNRTAVKSPAVLYRDGKLSVNAPSALLNEVMKEISNVTGIKVVWQGEEISRPVTTGFNERPFEEAIEKILYGENYMLSYSRQDIVKITILPRGEKSSDKKIEKILHDQSITGLDMFSLNDAEKRELNSMEQASIERWTRLEEVRNISSLEDKEEAAGQLITAMVSNPEPEARLLALETLNEMAPVQTDILIETVSRDEDPRVKLRAIDLLAQRLDVDPGVETFLTAYFANYEQNMN